MESSAERIEATFCFVHVAGYTALTETHGDEAAADLMDRLQALVERALAGRGSVLQVIGDAVLFMTPDAARAIAAMSDLFGRAANEPGFPVLRAGLHHGTALLRGARFFGTTLNLAARVAAQAHGGQALATKEVAAAAAAQGIPTRDLGLFRLRNLTEPVPLFEVLFEPGTTDHALDPVCRMRVERRQAGTTLHFAGTDYWFCSPHCAALFAARPERYARSEKPKDREAAAS